MKNRIVAYLELLEENEEIMKQIFDFVNQFKEQAVENSKKQMAEEQTKKHSEAPNIPGVIKAPNPNFNKNIPIPRRDNKPLESGYIYEGTGDKIIAMDMETYLNNRDSLKKLYGSEHKRLREYMFKIKL